MKKILPILCLWLLTAFDAGAVYPRIRSFSKNKYRAGTQNWDIAQNRARVLYFANNGGLLEFDGAKWSLYDALNGASVRSLCYVQEESRLYTGSYNEIGYFETDARGRFAYTSMRKKFGSQDLGEIWNIHRIDNTFYFQGDRRIIMLRGDRVKIYDFEGRIDHSAVVNNLLFVSTAATGVQILSGDMFITIPGLETLRGCNICAILPREDGNVMIITDVGGFYLYGGVRIEKFRTPLDAYLPGKRIISAAANDRFLALGSIRDGLLIYDRENDAVLTLNRHSGMQNNTVWSLYFDIDGNLWGGLDNGIDCILLDLSEYRLFGTDDSYGAGYASLIHDGKLYLGTTQGFFWSGYDGSFPGNGKFDMIPELQGQVWCLADIGGTVLCGHDMGLYEIRGTTVRRIEGIGGVWKVMSLENRSDLVMGCSYSGLFILKNTAGQWRFSHRVRGFDESSGIFEEDRDGKVWFSHWIKGLFRLTFDADYTAVIDAEYVGMNKGMPTEKNNIPFRLGDEIVFASEGGFLNYDALRDSMIYDDRINSLFVSPPISTRVHSSPEGDLLFMSGTSFSVAAANQDGSYRIDSLSLGFLADELIVGFENLNFLGGQRVLLSNEKGFSIVDYGADRMRERERERPSGAPPVFLKHVFVTNRSDSLVYGERFSHEAHPELNLPCRDNSLRFEFASPEYKGEDAVEYSCILENFDEDWSVFSNADAKEYTGLKGGNYVFRVRAKNRFTAQTGETSYKFTVSPPWYAGRIAVTGYIMLAIGLCWLVVYYFNRHSESRVSEMEKRKELEIAEQKKRYEKAASEKEKEFVLLQNRTLEYELRNKSHEMASSTMNLIRKNEILLKIRKDLDRLASADADQSETAYLAGGMKKIQKYIRENIEHDQDWKKFQHNFDMVYENYLKRLTETYPDLNMNDQKLCAYIRMDLHSKDIAPLMNITVRGIEMSRYRLRKKMGLGRDVNLSDYLQKF